MLAVMQLASRLFTVLASAVLVSLGATRREGGAHVFVSFPKSIKDWTLKTDKSERPGVGQSTGKIEYVNQTSSAAPTLSLSGDLASIPSPTMGLVGFIVCDTAVTLAASPEPTSLAFHAKSSDHRLVFTAIVDVNQSALPASAQGHGTVTFQSTFSCNHTDFERVELPWSSFEATCRGRPVFGVKLTPDIVTGLGFQCQRSKQCNIPAKAGTFTNFELQVQQGWELLLPNVDHVRA